MDHPSAPAPMEREWRPSPVRMMAPVRKSVRPALPPGRLRRHPWELVDGVGIDPSRAIGRRGGFVSQISMIDRWGRGFVLRVFMTSARGTEEDDERHRRDQSTEKRQPATRDRRNLRGHGFALRNPMIDRQGRGFVLPIPTIDRRGGRFDFSRSLDDSASRHGRIELSFPVFSFLDIRLGGLCDLRGETISSTRRSQAGAADLHQGVETPEQRPAARKLVPTQPLPLGAGVERQDRGLLGRVGLGPLAMPRRQRLQPPDRSVRDAQKRGGRRRFLLRQPIVQLPVEHPIEMGVELRMGVILPALAVPLVLLRAHVQRLLAQQADRFHLLGRLPGADLLEWARSSVQRSSSHWQPAPVDSRRPMMASAWSRTSRGREAWDFRPGSKALRISL